MLFWIYYAGCYVTAFAVARHHRNAHADGIDETAINFLTYIWTCMLWPWALTARCFDGVHTLLLPAPSEPT